MKLAHREQIETIMSESGRELDRLHGQKRHLRIALLDIRKLNIHNQEIEEIIRRTLVLTFG